MKYIKIVILLVLIIFSCGEDLDDNLKFNDLLVNTTEVIEVDSELYNKLELLVNESIQTVTPITCIQFIFPIALFTIEEDGTTLPALTISSSEDFSSFLSNLQSTQSISLSYPISSTLSDGTEFIINNNQELIESLDECLTIIEDVIIGDCQNVLESCVWKIGYAQETENNFLGGVYQDNTGVTSFEFNNEIYTGTWTALIIEYELYLNINLIDSQVINDYFNLNWKVQYLDQDSIQLTNNDEIIILNKYCNANYNECNNFNFAACELQDTPEIAEFIFDDYTFCINTILQTEPTNTNISYFENYEDANNNENIIVSNEIYLNTTNNQIIYVRVEDIEEETNYIIEITIIAETC